MLSFHLFPVALHPAPQLVRPVRAVEDPVAAEAEVDAGPPVRAGKLGIGAGQDCFDVQTTYNAPIKALKYTALHGRIPTTILLVILASDLRMF